MKKHIPNFASGFSMAELLISMMIAMVLATALVPVVGPKKILKLRNRFNHGVAECYYAVDESGGVSLQSYYFDTRSGLKKSPLTAGGDHCTLIVPKASYYSVITVGAGGYGVDGRGNNTGLHYDTLSTYIYGYQLRHPLDDEEGVQPALQSVIHLNEDYKSDIDNAENFSKEMGKPVPGLGGKIRKTLNEWANDAAKKQYLYALVATMTSPMGKGGQGTCHIHPSDYYTIPGCECAPSCRDREYLSGQIIYSAFNIKMLNGACYYFLHGRGLPSGRGIQLTNLKIPVNGNSDISIEDTYEKIGVSVSPNDSIELTKSEDGATPEQSQVDGGYFNPKSQMDPSECIQNGFGNAAGDHTCRLLSSSKSTAGHGGADHGDPDYSTGRCYGLGGKSATKGSVQWADATNFLKWTYSDAIFHGSYGQRGDYGSENVAVYEQLPSRLYLYPAKDIDEPSQILRKERSESEEDDVFTSAPSGKHGKVVNEAKVPYVPGELPYIQSLMSLAVADNKDHFTYLATMSDANARIEKKKNAFTEGTPIPADCDDDTKRSCPGFAGNGIYPMVYYTESKPNITIINNNNGAKYSRDVDSTESSNLNRGCKSGYALREGGKRNYVNNDWDYQPKYCDDSYHKGYPGAVIIIW